MIAASTALIAATYGLVRLAYGLFLPDVQADLGLGSAAAGAVSAGASLSYGLGAVAGFLLAARRRRRLVAAAAACAAVGSAGMALAPDAVAFGAAAILGSAGAALASPALVSVVQRRFSGRAGDRAQAVVNAGTGPGLVAAGALALGVLPDWRAAWGIVCIVTIVVAAVVLLLDSRAPDPDTPSPRGAGADEHAAHPPTAWVRAHAGIVGAALLMGAGSGAVWNYGRAVLVHAGADERASVWAWIALGAGGAAVIATSRGMTRLSPRASWTVTSTAVALATAGLALAPAVPLVALSACALFGWGYTAGSGVLIQWTAAVDPRRAPAGTSALFIVLILGQGAGAAAVGALAGPVGYAPPFLGAAAVTLAGVAIAAAVRPRSAPPRGR